MGSSQGRKRALDTVGAVLMQWAMRKDQEKQALANKIAQEDAAKEKIKLMLEKRKLDQEWDIKKMDYQNKLKDEDRADERSYAEQQAEKQRTLAEQLEAKRKAEIEADNALIGTTKDIVGNKESQLVYMGANKGWVSQKKEGVPSEPKDEMIRLQQYRDTLTPKDKLYQKKLDETNARILKITNNNPSLTDAGLTKLALGGDKDALSILKAKDERAIKLAYDKGKAGAEGKIEGLAESMDITGTARSIILGKETLGNVKNTFGVPIQERVRKEVLSQVPDFNFNKPRVTADAVKSSLVQQQKQRGMMGSFVKNLNSQVVRVDEVMKDVISRVGIRAIDLPMRELRTRAKGSGHEKVVEAYLTEISAEIGKLSTGSTGSVRELSTEAQERWGKIHDPNLSLKELKKILEETKAMGAMRLESVDSELDETLSILDNVNDPYRDRKAPPQTPAQKPRFKIIGVED